MARTSNGRDAVLSPRPRARARKSTRASAAAAAPEQGGLLKLVSVADREPNVVQCSVRASEEERPGIRDGMGRWGPGRG